MENGPFLDGLPIKNGDVLIAMLVCQRVILEVSGRPFNHIKPPKPFRRVEKDLQGCSLIPF